ncbi:MAG: hypothetical protein MJ141_00755 [Clostridia bacterium]|nr:hypothetical protein [Clostridia bacterium]
MKTEHNRAWRYLLVTLVCLIALAVPAFAVDGFMPGVTASFATGEETAYTTTRAKTVTFGDVQWKITDADGFSTGKDGLATDGIAALVKSNPVTAAAGWRIEIVYATLSEDAEEDAETAFFTTSTSNFGTSVPMIDPSTAIGVAENGDIYLFGKKINHENGAKAEDILTSKSASIAPGEECRLMLQYAEGKLTISLSHGGKTVMLVDHYSAGTIAGLCQLQLGGDKNTEKRVAGAVYKEVTFSLYEKYVPHVEKSLKAVVQSGETVREYADLERALIDAKESAHLGNKTVLQLYADLTLAHPLEIQSGWDFTLDLNGFIVDRGRMGYMASDGYVISVFNGAKLTIEDSDPESTRFSTTIRGGVITGGAGSSVGGGIIVNAGSTLVMNGGNIANCVTDDHGGAIRVAGEGAKITIRNAGFYGNRTYKSSDNCHGGAIFGDDDCVINISDSIFEGNYSEDNGGAIYLNDGRLAATNCIFSGNKSLDDGGAVYVESGASAAMDNCRFYQNRADGDGGAVYCNSSEGTRMTGKFFGNTAGDDGGAVYVCGDAVCPADAEVRLNQAGDDGSGVYVDEMYDLNVQGLLSIRDNVNAKSVKDDVFLNNTIYASAHIYDGGLYDGSEVYVRADDAGHEVIENVSEYQAAFFKSDVSGRNTTFKVDPTKPEFYSLVTSAVGRGDLLFIVISALLGTAVVVFLVIRQKKNGKGAEKK